MKTVISLVATVILGMAATPAIALCIYNGVDNAKTTLSQEFHDSSSVVQVRVISAKDHWSDSEDLWTTYDLEVLHAYKSHPPRHLKFFTTRDSGGFYMDKAWVALPAGHDIGGKYLLFLNPWPARKDLPPEAKGAVFVNYTCGVSGPWADVSPADRGRLARLERGH
jgi:hypothetical protein